MKFSVLKRGGRSCPSCDGGCRAGVSFRPAGFVVVDTSPRYVSTLPHLVVGVVVAVMDHLGVASLRGDEI